jgi:hypothetical protein
MYAEFLLLWAAGVTGSDRTRDVTVAPVGKRR